MDTTNLRKYIEEMKNDKKITEQLAEFCKNKYEVIKSHEKIDCNTCEDNKKEEGIWASGNNEGAENLLNSANRNIERAKAIALAIDILENAEYSLRQD